MELTQALIIVGVIGAVVLVIIAVRGSFKDDDAFYGEPPAIPGESTTAPDAGGPRDIGQGSVPPDGHGRGDSD